MTTNTTERNITTQNNFLQSTTWFLEYNVDQHELEEELGFVDPSCPPAQGCNNRYLQWRVRRFVENIIVRILTFLFIVADMFILIADLFNDPKMKNDPLEYCSVTFSTYFLIEVSLRLYALGSFYFKTWENFLDFTVVLITFVLSIVTVCLDNMESSPVNLLVILRLVRLLRIVRILWQQRHITTGARQFISQNKRRFQRDGFDLDLTYVTPRVIAMSFPSSGRMSLYRNDIKEVSRFFNLKHKDHYMIYNLCSERSYDQSHFYEKVERYLIDDHNVPSLQEMLNFSESCRSWLSNDEKNVIAVHCKGGKGRTGTMICVSLIDSGLFRDAEHCLGYFGDRRTDKNAGRKFQGVETPSQSRYVGYYEKVVGTNRRIPNELSFVVTSFRIKGISSVGRGDGSDFSITIQSRYHDSLFEASPKTNKNCQVTFLPESDEVIINITNSPILRGDTKIMFHSKNNNIPRGYENCPFYFWFHTAFIKEERLDLCRHELDNPHKSKTWKFFKEQFKVSVIFKEAR